MPDLSGGEGGRLLVRTLIEVMVYSECSGGASEFGKRMRRLAVWGSEGFRRF
jgi:hypothetical protein